VTRVTGDAGKKTTNSGGEEIGKPKRKNSATGRQLGHRILRRGKSAPKRIVRCQCGGPQKNPKATASGGRKRGKKERKKMFRSIRLPQFQPAKGDYGKTEGAKRKRKRDSKKMSMGLG